ncbi:MAG: AmmeMemoRadiSam system radical SAM enzyme [Verrucomicrobia bacterium]|nr:AmmeMemoRadiSam system radical SAM enzyme [Verrucomicrobiota bacterium]
MSIDRELPPVGDEPPPPGGEVAPAVANPTLAERLDAGTAEGALWRLEGRGVRCVACGHRCLIGENRRGICRVRFNRGGRLQVPFGYVNGLQNDPIEKKPFYHVQPGAFALTFGMLGCDLHCAYCQNWVTSQALRDSAAAGAMRRITPEAVVECARRAGARLVVSSYNEPLITAEWAAAIFRLARPAGLGCALVSNGHATPEVLEYLGPLLTAIKIDLKGFDARRYRSLGGNLGRVLETIRAVHARRLWLEIVTLVVPGFNDDEAELRALARFIASVSPDIPWHVTAFHPDYQMRETAPTGTAQLLRAAEIGAGEGLRFVYAGNRPGRVGRWEHTWCPHCHQLVVERAGWTIRRNRIDAEGRCGHCRAPLPGVWAGAADPELPCP